MPKRVTVVPALAIALLAAAALNSSLSGAAHAAPNCVTAPKLQAGQAGRWYYRSDRATGRRCWFIGAQGMKVRRALQRKAQPLPLPVPRPAIDPPAQAAAAANARTQFSVRWAGAAEPVGAIAAETPSTQDAARPSPSPAASRIETPPRSLLAGEPGRAAAPPAHAAPLSALPRAVLAFVAVIALAAIGWAMFARRARAVRQSARPHLRDLSVELRNPAISYAELTSEPAAAVTASGPAAGIPKPASDPPRDRVQALEDIHRNLGHLGPDPLTDRLDELKEVHRHMEELLGLLRGSERTAA
jgi:hypothetical protein